MRIRFILAILVCGVSGIVAQILLLREMLITFLGNELTIGIILANWLILEAVGAFLLGKTIDKIISRIEIFIIVQIIFSVFLPITIYLTRVVKVLLGITPGEGLGLLPILYSSFIILLPVSITHGALFTFSCKIYSEFQKEEAVSIGKVYIYETVGTLIGGIVFTYFLIYYFSSLQIVFGIVILNLIICILLTDKFWQKGLITKITGSISGILFILCTYFILSGGVDRIHKLSINKQFYNQNVICYQNSIYGNIAVVKTVEQYTFYSDGIPIITIPNPDIIFIEEFVHFSMLSHPNPKNVLLISGGAGGVINEILKYPVERIDYVELDPTLLKIVNKFSTELTLSKRINIKNIDGRLFVKQTHNKYDVVLIGLNEPSSLQVNRLFTNEFFYLVKDILDTNGILVINLPGSLTYLSDELKNLNLCILETLKSVYKYVHIIPGEFNLFIAFNSKDVQSITSDLLIKRFKEYKLNVKLLTEGHISYRLDKRWLRWFLSSLKGTKGEINYDFLPLGVFHSLALWNALFSPNMQWLFKAIKKVKVSHFIILFIALTVILLLLSFKISKFKVSIPYAILSTGFGGMIYDLILILGFQILYGYVYHTIGLLITIFMLGITFGGLLVTNYLGKIKNELGLFIKFEILIIIFSFILPFLFVFIHPYFATLSFIPPLIFFILCFISGLLTGAEFPLANRIYLKNYPNVSGTAGLLYGLDLLGGFLSGLAGGIMLLPCLGLVNTCLIVIMFKISSLIIVVLSSLFHK